MLAKLLVLVTALVFGITTFHVEEVRAQEKSHSQLYVEAMGHGWNLGNTFDSFDEYNDREEVSWGNPVVTRELIKEIKQKGFDNIRLPFTSHMRIDGPENNYKIDEDFLTRYEEVVRWSLEEDLYVMVNVHHDSWTWLTHWNGDIEAEEHIKYSRIWEQLAERFKDFDERLMFESINEPEFDASEESQINYVATLNNSFYNIVRHSGGKNADRMLVMPGVYSDHTQNRLDALYNQIEAFDDNNIIATVHYYGDWVYSTNIGKTRFDGILWGSETPRTSMDKFFDRVTETFIDRGIGVIIGEYGVLGYDKSETVNQFGETLKYLESINHHAKEKGISLILWDNGQHFNRNELDWYNLRFGEMIEESMHGRSAYSTDLDTYYISKEKIGKEISIPLTLNGLELETVSIDDRELVYGEDYTFHQETVTLREGFLEELLEKSELDVGTVHVVDFYFSSGADWQMKLIYTDTPVLKEASGTKGENFVIPSEFNGQHLEHVQSKDEIGKVVSLNDWWDFLEHGKEFIPLYEEGSVQLSSEYTSLLDDGKYDLLFTFYDGKVLPYQLIVEDGVVQGQEVNEEISQPKEVSQEEVAQFVSTQSTLKESRSLTSWLPVVIGIVLVSIGLRHEAKHRKK